MSVEIAEPQPVCGEDPCRLCALRLLRDDADRFAVRGDMDTWMRLVNEAYALPARCEPAGQ